MKTVIKIAIITLLTAGTLGGCAYRLMHKTPEERAAWLVKNISEELRLNEAQLAKLNELKAELLAMRGDYRKNRADTKQAIGALLSQPRLDQARALALIQDRTREVNDKAPPIVNAFAAFYDSLTAEQQKKLHDEVMEQLQRHHGYWDED